MAITKASAKRAAMSKKSPYAKTGLVKARKTVQRQMLSTVAKEVATKSIPGKRTPTKTERLNAKARARAWAKRELGQKKKDSQSRPRSQVNEAVSTRFVSAKTKEKEVAVKVKGSINEEMIRALHQVDKDDSNLVGNISEEFFFDALEFLPAETSTEEDFVVEDATDDDDEDIIDLRSTTRNQKPGESWMEPVGTLYSDILGVKKPDP